MEALSLPGGRCARRSSRAASILAVAGVMIGSLIPLAADAQFVTGLAGGSGSTIGPDGALYVTEGAVGRVSRVDPSTGAVSPFASGLPPWIIGLGGAMDVAFLDGTAYVLVTLVGPDTAILGAPPGTDTVGIYRVDGPDSFTVIADIGTWAIDHPPEPAFFIPSGVQYSLEPFRGGFLVADGHHNRVLRISLDGEISEFQTFGNEVPTGLEIWGNRVLLALAGPVPHVPEDGKVVTFGPKTTGASEVASGARLAVDVEFGLGRRLYALSQGEWNGQFEGSPALPNTGALFEVNADGSMTMIADGLNLPTSIEFIGNTAYIVNLLGEIWKIDDVSTPPYGVAR